LRADWDRHNIDIPLTVIDSPYREITRPIVDYVRRIRRQSPRDVVTVFIPEYVVGHWWEQLLHNQSALRLKSRLLFQPPSWSPARPTSLSPSNTTPPRAKRGDLAPCHAPTHRSRRFHTKCRE